MKDEALHKTVSFITTAENLSQTLGIAECTPELQMKIISAWSDLLVKRMLLRTPEEHTELVREVIAEAHESGKDLGEMLEILTRSIPGFEQYIEEETTRLLGESVKAA